MFSQGQIIALVLVFLVLIGGGIGIWYYTTKKEKVPSSNSGSGSTSSNTKPVTSSNPVNKPITTTNPINTNEPIKNTLNGKYFFVKGQTVQFDDAKRFCELPNQMVDDTQSQFLNKNITMDENRAHNWGNPIWSSSGNRLLWDVNQKKYRVVDKEYPWPYNSLYALPACIGTQLQPRVAYVKLGDSSKIDWN